MHSQPALSTMVLIMVASAVQLPLNICSAATRTTDLEIYVVTRFGQAVSGVTLKAFNELEKRDYSDRIVGTSAHNLPYGVYSIRAEKRGFAAAERRVILLSRRSWVTLAIAPDIDSKPEAIKWSIRAAPAKLTCSKCWARVYGIYSDNVYDIPIDRSGMAALVGAPPGYYWFLLFENGEVKGASPLQLSEDRRGQDIIIEPGTLSLRSQ